MKSGAIRLRSGEWNWYELELHSVPAWTPAFRILSFEDPTNKKNEMMLKLPVDAPDIDEDRVKILASNPDERTFVDRAGVIWRATPIPRPPIAMGVPPGFEPGPDQVSLSATDGRSKIHEVPSDLHLGDLTHDELIHMVSED